jgi:hypothetical protein
MGCPPNSGLAAPPAPSTTRQGRSPAIPMTHGPCRSAASCSRTSAPPPASQSAGAGQLFGRLAPACRLQRLIRRPGRALGGRLSAALEHHRLERSAALEGLHPAHAGRSRFPYPERSARRASDLASARGSRPGPHPRVLPRLRGVEEPRDVAAARRSRMRRSMLVRSLAYHCQAEALGGLKPSTKRQLRQFLDAAGAGTEMALHLVPASRRARS